MPNLMAHVGLALLLAERLPNPLLERHKGALLLGSTAPDIRAMTGASRELTHFAPLESRSLQEGADALFAAHRGLADPCALSEETRSFLLGYLSHLVTDQAWVALLYRPCFQAPGLFPDAATARVMDRALQMEMDRRAAAAVAVALPALEGAEAGVDVGFIDGPTLGAWRRWLEERLAQGFTWERLRFMARRRQDPSDLPAAEGVAQRFLASVERGLAELEALVPWSRVEEFQAVALAETERQGRRVLQCAW